MRESKKHSLRLYWKETDKILLFLCLFASAYGTLLVYSATKNNIKDGALLPRDTLVMMLAILIGVIACIVISTIDYEDIAKLWPIIAIVCVLLMLIVKIFGKALNPDRQDAASWLTFGSVSFQPSEILKIGFTITFAVHLDLVRHKLKEFKQVLLLGIHALIPIGLVVWTGDDGSALIFVLMFLCMMFAAGVHWGYFLAGFVTLAIAFPILWNIPGLINEYQKHRILVLFHPEEYYDVGYQQRQGITAIGSGQLTGQGLLDGSFTQSDSVPESQNDMIFTVAGEELGFLGAIAVVLLLAAIIVRIIIVGKRSKDFPGLMMCIGIATMLASQALINLGMCLRLFPVIGITLPFFSAGGSSNMTVYFGIGLVMSIYRYNQARDPVNFRLRHIATSYSE